MESHPVTIGGEEVALSWDQQTARAYPYRVSKIGGAPSLRDLTNPKRATAAITDLLWLILPPATAAKYRTPEELFVAIDHEAHAPNIHAAVVAVFSQMVTSEEKKRSSLNSHSQESNSA